MRGRRNEEEVRGYRQELDHYRQGIALLHEGRKLEGQVELANAFFMVPDRKDFRDALEATLSKSAREIPHTWEELKAKHE